MRRGKQISMGCPYCKGSMRIAAMECPSCGVEVRGRFAQFMFQRLTAEEQRFLEQYLLAGFSIKSLAERTGMGYAAIRSRLDRLIESYSTLLRGEESTKRIMDQVAAGELTAAEAAERIREMGYE